VRARAATPPQAIAGPTDRRARDRASHLVRAMRPRQWGKNLLVFLAPAAAGVLSHFGVFLHVLGACGVFCAAAAGTYLVNDAVDAEADRRHPDKRLRPVANGDIPVRAAVVSGAALATVAIAGAWLVAGWSLAVVVGAYVIVSTAYSLRLKREPVVELAAVASCFVLRAVAGGAAAHVPLSNWFLVVTCFGALFIVVGKRSAEHARLGSERGDHRPVLTSYTPSFLRSTLTLAASVALTAYFLWAFEATGLAGRAGSRVVWIQLTVVPVILGTLHVLWLLDAGRGGTPEDLALRDRFLQALGVLWLVFFSIGLYG
jgi:decaprenyl-phosphate phosphoribosyltransferase